MVKIVKIIARVEKSVNQKLNVFDLCFRRTEKIGFLFRRWDKETLSTLVELIEFEQLELE